MTTEKVFPRFLGVDSNGDFVWELASGRWTWGETPYEAASRERTFTADRYLDKYGPVGPVGGREGLPGSAPPVPEISEDAMHAAVREAYEDGKKKGAERLIAVDAHRTLSCFLGVLDGWIEGVRDNHGALGHRNEGIGEECWRSFAPSDIRCMVNDAARELGLSVEFAAPEVAKEDEAR